MMFVLMLGTAIVISSCGKDDDSNNTENNGTANNGALSGDTSSTNGTTLGGGASFENIVGEYVGVATAEYPTYATFNGDGTGVIEYNGKKISFKYSIVDGVGVFETATDKRYIRIVDGFLLIERPDGSIVYMFYKRGKENLGDPNTSKIIGTWGSACTHCTFNVDGTGVFLEDDKKDGEISFTYSIKNAFVTYCTLTGEDKIMLAVRLGDKLYMLDADGERGDENDILTKK